MDPDDADTVSSGSDPQPMAAPPEPDAGWEARCLLRAARSATLATQSGGQPYAALVTPAIAPDGSVLMLLSGLSEHTRHLRVDPRCALMAMGGSPEANPQTAPRVTIMGQAAPEHDPAQKARWLAVHPYAAFYADLADFSLWRIQPTRGQFVGGFARAARLARAELESPATILAAEPSIIAHCNRDHADALDLIAHHAMAQGGDLRTGWHMVTADDDGFHLARQEAVIRIPWSAPAPDAMRVRHELVRLAHAARAASPAG